MNITTLIDEILGTSTYVGVFSYADLLKYGKSHAISGVGVSDDKTQKFIIAFEKGEPTGVILIEEKGALFGEKAAYLLQEKNNFELFSTEPSLVNALASRCRVFDKIHLQNRLAEDLPSIGERKHSPGVLCLTIVRNGTVQSGMRVSIRKGRQVIGNDITTSDGRASFKLLNGKYDCVVLDKTQEVYTFMIDFKDAYAESIIDIGG
jgi:hypothetical protein